MKKIALILAPALILSACATTKTYSGQPTAACQTREDNAKLYPNGAAGNINTSIFQCKEKV